MESWIHYLIEAIYVFTIVGIIIVIISENRNPIKTLAWLLTLTFLPVIGLILYFFVGQNYTKKHNYYKKRYADFNKNFLNSNPEIPEDNYPAIHSTLIKLSKNMQDARLYGGNQITFFDKGKNKFEALFSDIEQANHHIHLESFIVASDKLGNRLKELLIQKAREGVEIRFIIDTFGSLFRIRKKFIKEMIDAGIEVQFFGKVKIPILSSNLNYRDHRKIIVIDGKIGYIGGLNIADEYIDGLKWGKWCDTHCRIVGSGVQGLQTVFLINWYYLVRDTMSIEAYYPKIEKVGKSMTQTISSGPTSPFPEIKHAMTQAFYSAERSIYIETPYFIPPESICEALKAAAIRGVDVKIIIPKRSDSPIVHFATCSYIKSMLEVGIKMYFYTPGFLHSKMSIIDDNLTLMGSANFDIRSFEQNLEIKTFIYGQEAATEAIKIFEQHLTESIPIEKEKWEKRSWGRRAIESVIRLLAPLL